VAALQTCAPSLGHAALGWLDGPPPLPRPELVLTDLLNDLAALPQACLLVLDDYHLVRATAIHRAVAFLLDHVPPTVHLVIATREDPPLPLPRLRARGHLTEIRAADPNFTPEEAAHFLGDSMGLHLADEAVGKLVDRTEGWAAGLQLAGLALRDRADPAAFVAAFAGGHRLGLKLIFRADDRKLLGVHCIGDVASETIGLGHAVIAMGGTIELLLTLGLNLPTYSAAYHDAAIDGLSRLAGVLGLPSAAQQDSPAVALAG
jgi:hypothetical protein